MTWDNNNSPDKIGNLDSRLSKFTYVYNGYTIECINGMYSISGVPVNPVYNKLKVEEFIDNVLLKNNGQINIPADKPF